MGGETADERGRPPRHTEPDQNAPPALAANDGDVVTPAKAGEGGPGAAALTPPAAAASPGPNKPCSLALPPPALTVHSSAAAGPERAGHDAAAPGRRDEGPLAPAAIDARQVEEGRQQAHSQQEAPSGSYSPAGQAHPAPETSAPASRAALPQAACAAGTPPRPAPASPAADAAPAAAAGATASPQAGGVRTSATGGGPSRYRGVVWHKSNSKWEARVYEGGKQRFLGYFTSEDAAARAYDEQAARLHGDPSRLNFPGEHTATLSLSGGSKGSRGGAGAAAASPPKSPRSGGRSPHGGRGGAAAPLGGRQSPFSAVLGSPEGSPPASAGQAGRRSSGRAAAAAKAAPLSQPRAQPIKGTSRFRGVSWNSGCSKWRTQVWKGNEVHHVGYFEQEMDAARAYDAAALRIRGPDAPTNFPPSDYPPQAGSAPSHHHQQQQQQQHLQQQRQHARQAPTTKRERLAEPPPPPQPPHQATPPRPPRPAAKQEQAGLPPASWAATLAVAPPPLAAAAAAAAAAAGAGSGGSSTYTGVSWDARRSGWLAELWDGQQHRELGVFAVERDAARAYDLACLAQQGPGAHTNFPLVSYDAEIAAIALRTLGQAQEQPSSSADGSGAAAGAGPAAAQAAEQRRQRQRQQQQEQQEARLHPFVADAHSLVAPGAGSSGSVLASSKGSLEPGTSAVAALPAAASLGAGPATQQRWQQQQQQQQQQQPPPQQQAPLSPGLAAGVAAAAQPRLPARLASLAGAPPATPAAMDGPAADAVVATALTAAMAALLPAAPGAPAKPAAPATPAGAAAAAAAAAAAPAAVPAAPVPFAGFPEPPDAPKAAQKAAETAARRGEAAAPAQSSGVSAQNRCSGSNRGLSAFNGVSWDKRKQRWFSQIQQHGKRHFLGYYDTEAGAARAYDRAALRLYGPGAQLNLPDEIEAEGGAEAVAAAEARQPTRGGGQQQQQRPAGSGDSGGAGARQGGLAKTASDAATAAAAEASRGLPAGLAGSLLLAQQPQQEQRPSPVPVLGFQLAPAGLSTLAAFEQLARLQQLQHLEQQSLLQAANEQQQQQQQQQQPHAALAALQQLLQQQVGRSQPAAASVQLARDSSPAFQAMPPPQPSAMMAHSQPASALPVIQAPSQPPLLAREQHTAAGPGGTAPSSQHTSPAQEALLRLLSMLGQHDMDAVHAPSVAAPDAQPSTSAVAVSLHQQHSQQAQQAQQLQQPAPQQAANPVLQQLQQQLGAMLPALGALLQAGQVAPPHGQPVGAAGSGPMSTPSASLSGHKRSSEDAATPRGPLRQQVELLPQPHDPAQAQAEPMAAAASQCADPSELLALVAKRARLLADAASAALAALPQAAVPAAQQGAAAASTPAAPPAGGGVPPADPQGRNDQ
ncbi:hypothetical protein ABPG75_009412 [Micractinium tetrahymenae]